MGYSFDDTLDAPYFVGAPVSPLVPNNFPIALAGHPFMIDVKKFSRSTLPAVAPRQDQSPDITEGVLNRDGYARMGQSRFGLGSGQLFFDDQDTSNPRRFYQSKGVDPWPDRGLTLLHGTEKKGGTNAPGASSNLTVLSVGGWLYVADATKLKLTANPSTPNPTWTSIDAGGTISSICTDGVNVYVAVSGTGLQKTTIGSNTLAPFGLLTPNLVAYANGRLLGGEGSTLYEIDATGAKPSGANIRVDPRTTGSWVAVTSSPHAVFAAFNVGGNCEVYGLGVDSTSTAIDSPVWSCGLPDGETMNAMTFYAGVVIFATSVGVRIAQIITTFSATTNARTLEFGEAIGNFPGQTPLFPGGVLCLEPQGNFMWFGWSNYDSTSTGLGRANLATTISADTVVPGYASDLMAGVTGNVVQGNVTGVATFAGKRYFTVAGSGLYGEQSTYVQSGTYNSGWIRYHTLFDKQFASMQLGTDPMVGSILLSLTFMDGTQRDVGAYVSPGSTQSTLLDVSGRSVAAQVNITLNQASPTSAPMLRYWALMSYLVPPRVDEIILPLMLARKIEDLIGEQWPQDPLTELEFLEGLKTSNSSVVLQVGREAVLVRVDNIAILEGDINSWQDPRGRGGQNLKNYWFDGVRATVRCLTRES